MERDGKASQFGGREGRKAFTWQRRPKTITAFRHLQRSKQLIRIIFYGEVLWRWQRFTRLRRLPLRRGSGEGNFVGVGMQLFETVVVH